MDAAFLAPAVAASPSVPVGTVARVVPLEGLPPLAGSALAAAAGRTAGAVAFALGAVALRSAGRRGRAQRRAAAAVEADAELAFKPSQQIGTGAPLGFFDPLGFTKVGDQEGFRKLRASELKHGRVAMMASIGLVGQHFIRLPGFEKTPAGFAAVNTGEGVLGFVGILVLSAFLELAWREEKGREPGNFGDPLGFNMYNEDMRVKEINNGRMAMVSVLGIFAAELASGKDAIQQFGF